MEILSKNEIFLLKGKILSNIKNGAVFIYPTDTIYGVGCNARSAKAVARIRRIKKRDTKPFSVIAPSKKWIKDNCEGHNLEAFLGTLPAPYTLILRLKKKSAVALNVNLRKSTIGVRIPDHWFTRFVKSLRLPLVTTSVNLTGKQHITSLDDLPASIASQIDFFIYDGVHKGKPSRIIDLTREKPRITHR